MANQRAKASRDVRAGRADVQKGVHQLTRSVKHIELSLRRAEREIEADAWDRVRKLRNEARAQLAVLRRHQREASRILTAAIHRRAPLSGRPQQGGRPAH